jgi:hypothetical protein
MRRKNYANDPTCCNNERNFHGDILLRCRLIISGLRYIDLDKKTGLRELIDQKFLN